MTRFTRTGHDGLAPFLHFLVLLGVVFCLGCTPSPQTTADNLADPDLAFQFQKLSIEENIFDRIVAPPHPEEDCHFSCNHQRVAEIRAHASLWAKYGLSLPGLWDNLGPTTLCPALSLIVGSVPLPTLPQSSLSTNTQDDGWVTTEVADILSFKAPEKLEPKEMDGNTVVYASSDNKYVVIVTQWNGNIVDDRFSALIMLKEMVTQEAEAEVAHSSLGHFNGVPALRFGLSVNGEVWEDGESMEFMTTFIELNTLIQVIVTNGEYEKFFNSIKVFIEIEEEKKKGRANLLDPDQKIGEWKTRRWIPK